MNIFAIGDIHGCLKELTSLHKKILSHEKYDVKKDALFQQGREEGIYIGVEKGIDIGEAKGLKKGIDIGKEKERLAIVIACLEEGDSYEKIARITKLDIKAIAKIDEERKKK